MYLHASIYTYVYVCIYTYIFMHKRTCKYIYLHIVNYIYLHICHTSDYPHPVPMTAPTSLWSSHTLMDDRSLHTPGDSSKLVYAVEVSAGALEMHQSRTSNREMSRPSSRTMEGFLLIITYICICVYECIYTYICKDSY
jgi:hypothetical protein